MEVTIGLIFIVGLVSAAPKCRTTVNIGVKWTVDCSAMNISTLPSPLSLHPIVVLNMSFNELSQLVDSQFVNWSSILQLDLSHNHISIIHNNSFSGLKDLYSLNLMNNFLEHLTPSITSNLPKLKILNLSHNKLKRIMVGSFQPIPQLLKLYLSNNFGLGEKEERYDSLKVSLIQGLRLLDITNISLIDLPYDFFYEINHLINLYLGYNPITEVPALPHSLRYLNLSGTLVDNVQEGTFSRSNSLQTLTLEGMLTLKELPAGSLSGLSSLTELTIKDCRDLNFISADVFGDSTPRLRRMTISRCAITTLSKNLKPLLSKVEYLDVQENPWCCDGRIAWLLDVNILPNLTNNLRCETPIAGRGVRLQDYFTPRYDVHPQSSHIHSAILIISMVVFVGSIAAMVRHVSYRRAESYRQLQNIGLQERPMNTLAP